MANNRIPSLDGARAISIGLVIVAHLDLGSRVPGLWRLDMGNLGVRVFFVISGFIITTLLLAELNETGTVSLSRFYRRRAFRILPAYYFFLAALMLWSSIWNGSISWPKIWPAPVFLVNYVNTPLLVGHAWSLSVEEQFYLLWPGALILLGQRRCVIGCIAVLLLAPLFRLMCAQGVWPTSPRYAFECVADALAVGCLLAILRDSLWVRTAYRRFASSSWCLLPLLAALMLIAFERNTGTVYYTIGLSLLNISIAIGLDHFMRVPSSPVGRFLNAAPVIWVGLVSYSLYLWQQPFAWTALPSVIKILLIFACAVTSYYVVERPLLSIGKGVERRRTTVPVKQAKAV